MRTRDGSAWHLAEAERLIGRARAEAAPRPRVLAALRILIAWCAGEKAPAEHKDDGACDRCFRRVYRGAELCGDCRGGEPPSDEPPAAEARRLARAGDVEREAERVAEEMKYAPPGRRTHADLGLDRPVKWRDGRPKAPKDAPRVNDPDEARRLLARLLARHGALTPGELWQRCNGAVGLEGVLALLRHDWFARREGGAYAVTRSARVEYLNALARRSKTPS